MIAVAIRNNIKKILDDKGWSIRKLSQSLDKDYGYVHRLVSTDPLPGGTTIGSLMPVAEALGVTINDLIHQEPE